MTENRIEKLRLKIDEMLLNQQDAEHRRCGYLHLYGVADACALLALKRGQNVELALAMGMLHDYATYKYGEIPNHAARSADEARSLLQGNGGFSDDEIDIIANAIENHSEKGEFDAEMDELLKDADVLQHYLYNPALKPKAAENARLFLIFCELGISLNEG